MVIKYLDGKLSVAADQLGSLGRYRSSKSNSPTINKLRYLDDYKKTKIIGVYDLNDDLNRLLLWKTNIEFKLYK